MKLVIFALAIAVIISPASAWSIEIFGYKFGDQEYSFASSQDSENRVFSISSDMTIDNVKWSLDGTEVQSDNSIKQSYLKVPKMNTKDGKNIIEYKAGKDKKTHEEVHKVTLEYDGGIKTWFVMQ